jgi:hypothetical protein
MGDHHKPLIRKRKFPENAKNPYASMMGHFPSKGTLKGTLRHIICGIRARTCRDADSVAFQQIRRHWAHSAAPGEAMAETTKVRYSHATPIDIAKVDLRGAANFVSPLRCFRSTDHGQHISSPLRSLGM